MEEGKRVIQRKKKRGRGETLVNMLEDWRQGDWEPKQGGGGGGKIKER